MAGTASESGVGGQQHCQSSEVLAEWRSSELVENGSPSTSLPYWDSDDDDDRGLKRSDLFGKHTWKIEKFSQINKREHRSNAFEIGGQKWYILIYPQGCDVCNHLSLFLCVDSYEKLLPGWSHFAQFTIAVVNKDPKKTKYSDTLHRFCKKEHDWGWKKFMEIPKVSDGFIDADALVIKAQVQVIRERPDRPFRCLDCQYRRELVRVYLTNVEQICRRFVEEIRGKLGKLIEDKASWSSFCTFWLGIDQNARRCMSREKRDSLLKVVVKHFFIEKEVTSTLVMDSLYSGLKALEGPTKDKKCNGKYLDAEEPPVPIVRTEKDTFILVDDVLQLLERAAIEPLPPKDEKGPQNRTKDGGSGEDFTKETIEQDERRLTELGRRTIEIFVLSHIFSKIETAYQEAVALKRQEELIREEEEAWMAESEQKTKRGVVDKEKKSKKKQGKQKRNNRRGKDKGKDEKPVVDKCEQEITSDIKNDVLIEETEQAGELNPIEDISDVSDSIYRIPGLVQPDSEDRDSSPVNWDTDTSEVNPSKHASGPSAVQNGDRKGSSLMDDSSSTCSTDSLPSLVMNGPYSLPKHKSQKTPSRGRHQRAKVTPETTGWASDRIIQQSYAGQANDISGSKVAESDDAVVHSLKKEEDVLLQRKLTVKEKDEMVKPTEVQTTIVPLSPRSPPKNLPSAYVQLKSEATPYAHKTATPKPAEKPMVQQVPVSTEKPKVQQLSSTAERPMAQQVLVTTERPMAQQVLVTTENPTPQQRMSRPIIPEPRQLAPVVSVAQTAAAPSRSVIAAGHLCPNPSTENPSYVAQSYRNVMPPVVSVAPTAPSLPHSVSAAGPSGPDPSTASPNYVTQSYRNTVSPVVSVAQTAPALLHSVAAVPLGPHPSNAAPNYVAQSYRNAMPPNSLQSYSHPSAPISAPVYLSQTSERTGLSSIRQGLSFGMVGHDIRQNRPQWPGRPEMDSSRSINRDPSMFIHQSRIQDLASELPVGMSRLQNQSVLTDEFPHLDIINDLLADEHGMGLGGANESSPFQSFGNRTHHLTRQFTFPGDLGPPSSSSCRFERTRSYHDGEFYSNYNSTGGQFDSNLIPEVNLGSYPNGQIDGLIPNQWQMAGSDLSYLSMRSSENNGFSYHIPEYSNLACAVDGYSVFPPASRH